MKRWLPLLLLLLAPAAFADSVDLSLAPPDNLRVDGGWGLVFIQMKNNGPGRAHDLRVTTTSSIPMTCNGCVLPDFAAGQHTGVGFQLPQDLPNGTKVAFTATVSSNDTDPDPSNNSIAFEVTLVRLPELRVYLVPPSSSDPDIPIVYTLEYMNVSTTPATGITATADLPDGTVVGEIEGAQCTVTGVHLECALEDLPGRTLGELVTLKKALIHAHQLARYDAPTLTGSATIRSSAGDDMDPSNDFDTMSYTLTRTFLVTTTADDGDGSLRRAIESANAAPDALPKIAFQIAEPLPSAGWFTISPLSPLPAITHPVMMDGAWQTAKTGDTNPLGPEVEISGAAVSDGDGLFVNIPCGFNLNGVAINSFPRNGVLVAAPQLCSGLQFENTPVGSISDSVLGADPTGSRARPNGLRGISIVLPDMPRAQFTIQRNLISGNRLSAIWAPSGPKLVVTKNRMGVANDGSPLGNGASGVYLAISGSSISENVIANSRDFGIAIGGGAEYVDFGKNSIYDNGQLGIDVGLDGVGGGLTRPILFSASYDPATGMTTVTGTYPKTQRHYVYQLSIELFANDRLDPHGHAEAQTPIGSQIVPPGDFTIAVKGDYTGKMITATATIEDINTFAKPPNPAPQSNAYGFLFVTSEISEPVTAR